MPKAGNYRPEPSRDRLNESIGKGAQALLEYQFSGPWLLSRREGLIKTALQKVEQGELTQDESVRLWYRLAEIEAHIHEFAATMEKGNHATSKLFRGVEE